MKYTENPIDLETRIRAHRLYSKTTLESIIGAMLGDLGENPVILDLGCGNGNYFPLMSTRTPHYVGMDSNRDLLAEFSAKFKARKVLIHASMDAMPEFIDGTFDAIFSIYSIYYTENPGALVAGLHRFLREGGQLAILGPGTAAHAPEISALVDHVLRDRGNTGVDLDRPKNKNARMETFHSEIVPLVRSTFRSAIVSEVDTSLMFPDSAEWALYVASTPEARERLPGVEREELATAARRYADGTECRVITKSMLSVVARK